MSDPVTNNTVLVVGGAITFMLFWTMICAGLPSARSNRYIEAIDRNTAAIDRQTDALREPRECPVESP